MKKVITSNISGATGQPVKSGTLSHLQDAYKEGFQQIMQNLYGIANNDTTVHVLYGCVNSGSSSPSGTCNISAGAVYYNGELYFLPATSFVIATGLVAVIDVTENSTNFFVAGNADPVTMTDGSTPYVHSKFQVTIIDDDSTATGYIADYADFDFGTSNGTYNTSLVVGDITAVGGAITSISSGACNWSRVGKVVHFDIKISGAVLTGTNTMLIINTGFLCATGIVAASYPSAAAKLSTSYIGMYATVVNSGGLPVIQVVASTGMSAGTYDIYISGHLFS